MDQSYEFRAWFLDNWMRAGIIAAAVMFATLPVLWDSADRVLWLMLTLLPVYMIHQYEDHARGRFVKDFNATIGKGLPVLTRESAMVINVGGLWLLYLMTVNGAIHLLVAQRTRR